MPLRRLWALTDGLPHDAAVRRPDGFTPLEELVASHIEVADFWGRQLAALQGLKRHQLPDPVRIDRPEG